MKRFIATALILVLSLSLVSCGKDSFIGKWTATVEEEGLSMEMTMEFKEDGTCSMGVLGMTMSGTYTSNDDKIVMTIEFMGEKEETEFTYEVKGDELSLTSEGETQVFKKAK